MTRSLVYGVMIFMLSIIQSGAFSAQLTAEQVSQIKQTDIHQQEKAGANFNVSPSELPAKNRQACYEYCKKRKDCICTRNKECRVGYTKIKSWRAAGDNWIACRKKEYR